MITVNYKIDTREFAKAQLDFLLTKLSFRTLTTVVRICFYFILIGYGLKLYGGFATTKDGIISFVALIWMFRYKSIYLWLFNKIFQQKKLGDVKSNCEITDKKIVQRLSNGMEVEQLWSQIKVVHNICIGYIVPFKDKFGCRKFIWLPKASLTGKKDSFEKILKKNKIKIKNKRKYLWSKS